MRALWAILLLAGCQAAAPLTAPVLQAGPGSEIDAAVRAAAAKETPSLLPLYTWFHQNAELSLQETKTAARFAAELRSAGLAVTEGIGGTGVVGVLENGAGPIVFARVDMDGLPVKEETGLPYASTSGVMHACGHDSHLTIGVGTARVLASLKSRWAGTLVLIGQPAEEVGKGALAMIQDPKFAAALPGKPVACLSLHDDTTTAGFVGICPGFASANVDSLDITLYGRGGHGALPHLTVDPIIIGAELVLALQTIVSRKLPPGTRAVVTVGSFHAGTKHNVIGDTAVLQLTVRSYEEAVRERLLSEIRHLSKEISEAHRATKPPEITYGDEPTPAGYHDPALSERMRGVFERQFGAEKVLKPEPSMGGEDFSRFPKHFGVPGLQFRVGGAKPGHDAAVGLHSKRWAVDPEPTILTGTTALSRACLELLGRK